ncbi:MAG: carboxyl-terminal protease, partial [Flavobacteriaceae bacterium]|nr:carboxyl-terminal protease [Flavobacteriaceae bacterium]
KVPGSETDLFGYVRLVLPGSDAESKGLQRGDVFSGIDGTSLNFDNYLALLSQDNYSIDLATYDNNGTPDTADDIITPGGGSVSLTKSEFTENPIFKTDILTVGSENVGYLMYNGFVRNFDVSLNSIFGLFQGNNIQHLVLDLRYNPGGSVNSSILLSSMITGQFTGQIYSTEQWNSDLTEQFFQQDPESLVNRFVDNDNGMSLNSLNLNTVYILTTGSSASASELVINCLDPYIDVIQIGTTTTGKYQASITVYDSPDLRREDANPNHTYAMQPLVLKEINAAGVTDYDNGLDPDIEIAEDISNLGVLGAETEPLLEMALDDIAGNRQLIQSPFGTELIADDSDFIRFGKEMYKTKTPPKSVRSPLKAN